MDLDIDVWKVRLFSSISGLSRTSAGSANRAYTKKPTLLITDRVQLQTQVAQNLTVAIGYVWDEGPKVASTDQAVKTFIDGIVTRVSDKLVAPSDNLRTWKLDKKKYPKSILPRELPLRLSIFYKIVALVALSDARIDPVQTAAWIERTYDGILHPLPDGCGRVAKLLGAWMLLRDGKYPAHFESSREYYDAMTSKPEIWEDFYRAHLPD